VAAISMLAVASAAVAFTVRPALVRPALLDSVPCANSPQMSLAPVDTMMLLADDSGFNPLFVVLGALPLIAGGAFFVVKQNEKAVADRRTDPANADRLGYTEEEVANMDAMTRQRFEQKLLLYQEDKAKAAELGVPVERVTAERLASSQKSDAYFDQDEVAGSTRF